MHRLAGWARGLYADALARSSGLILITSIITGILGFAYWVLAARGYAASDVGTAAVSVSMMTLASLVSTLGTTAAPVQRIPERRTVDEWNTTVTVSIAVGAGAGLLTGAVGWIILVATIHSATLRSTGYFLAVTLGVSLTNAVMVVDSVWVVERLTHLRLLVASLASLAKIPLLLLPPLHAAGSLGIQWAWTLGLGVGLAVGLVLLRQVRAYRPSRSGLKGELWAMRRSLLGNYAMGLGANAPSYIVPILVGAAVSSSATAYFYSAWRVGSLFFLAASSVSHALFAEGSRSAASAVRRAQRAMFVVIPALLISAALLAALGPAILSAFGQEYRRNAMTLLLILVAAAVPNAITTVYRTVMRIRRQYLQGSALMWGLAIIQVGLTWPMIHFWGITGAGVAWLLAESAGMVVAIVDRVTRGDPALRMDLVLATTIEGAPGPGAGPDLPDLDELLP